MNKRLMAILAALLLLVVVAFQGVDNVTARDMVSRRILSARGYRLQPLLSN